MHLSSFGAILVLCALGCAIFSIKRAPLSDSNQLDGSIQRVHQ